MRSSRENLSIWASKKPIRRDSEIMSDRNYWISTLETIAGPVLRALVARELKLRMPVEGKTEDRHQFTHLEALGRTLVGIAPWLESGETDGEEGEKRAHYAHLAREAIDAGTDPASPDYMNFTVGSQPLVDAAFLAHAILRAPIQLGEMLSDRVRNNLICSLKATRIIRPYFNNWLLFSAMVEAALCRLYEQWDPMRVDYALRQFEEWFVGDGMYGDGTDFHWDYYNSFVIQPMLIDVLETVGDHYPEWEQMKAIVLRRAHRYAIVQERMISPEGTFPAIGRSLAYRFGAFQHLAQIALRKELPEEITPAGVRSALTAVIRRMIEAPGTFDSDGWLKIGFCGAQSELGENYISTGSLYLCSAVLLPLGLKASDPFWSDPVAEWTNKRVWSSGKISIDKALH